MYITHLTVTKIEEIKASSGLAVLTSIVCKHYDNHPIHDGVHTADVTFYYDSDGKLENSFWRTVGEYNFVSSKEVRNAEQIAQQFMEVGIDFLNKNLEAVYSL